MESTRFLSIWVTTGGGLCDAWRVWEVALGPPGRASWLSLGVTPLDPAAFGSVPAAELRFETLGLDGSLGSELALPDSVAHCTDPALHDRATEGVRSARLAFALALASLERGPPARSDWLATGDLHLTGGRPWPVVPVGELDRKLLGAALYAWRRGISELLLLAPRADRSPTQAGLEELFDRDRRNPRPIGEQWARPRWREEGAAAGRLELHRRDAEGAPPGVVVRVRFVRDFDEACAVVGLPAARGPTRPRVRWPYAATALAAAAFGAIWWLPTGANDDAAKAAGRAQEPVGPILAPQPGDGRGATGGDGPRAAAPTGLAPSTPRPPAPTPPNDEVPPAPSPTTAPAGEFGGPLEALAVAAGCGPVALGGELRIDRSVTDAGAFLPERSLSLRLGEMPCPGFPHRARELLGSAGSAREDVPDRLALAARECLSQCRPTEPKP